MEDYSKMTNEELLALHAECIKQAEIYNLSQLGKKILLNSLYGACGNPYFLLYNKDMARGITLMGQCFIKKASKHINSYVSKTLKEKVEKNRIAYGDTDSVKGDSILSIEQNGVKKDVKISDLYDSSEGKNRFVIPVEDTKVLSLENDEVIYSPVKYVMKHNVKKRMYKITVDGYSVTVTEDHSIMVKRDGKLMEVKPKEVKDGDVFITIKRE